jgi:hypothetical protein
MSSLPCPPQHWERFSELLDTAMDMAEPRRERWLAALNGPDAELRPWLARVLSSAAAVRTGAFLDHPGEAYGPRFLGQQGKARALPWTRWGRRPQTPFNKKR